MSQVIVTDDKLNQKRQKSRDQEHRINIEGDYQQWRRSDVTKQDPVASLLGYGLLGFFGIFTVAGWFMLEIVVQLIFKPLGKMIGGAKSLITGH